MSEWLQNCTSKSYHAIVINVTYPESLTSAYLQGEATLQLSCTSKIVLNLNNELSDHTLSFAFMKEQVVKKKKVHFLITDAYKS